MKKTLKKRIKLSRALILICGVTALLVTVFGIYMYLVNKDARKLEAYTEVTFINPNTAIVFWKTEKDTLGFVKYSEKKFGDKKRVNQTSSEKGKIHAVYLENLPLNGVYLTKHSEEDGFLVFPKIELIKYEGSSENEE